MSRPLTILLTGFTSRQANTVSDRSNIYATTSPMLADMLRQLGHTVDWRPTIFGETNIEAYDLVMVGCSDPNSMTGMTFRYGAFWAMVNASRLMIWFDDWRIKGQYHSFVQNPELPWVTRLLPEKRLGEHAQALEYKPQITDMLVGLGTTDKAAVMAQLFNWGDESKFLKEVPEAKWLARFDISAFTPVHVTDPKPMAERERRWASASLSQMDDWNEKLKLTWPVVNQSKPRGKGFGSWKKMREEEIVKTIYRDSAGVICKPYSHAGSGWWRSRYSYAVQCRNVFLGDPKEVSALGWTYVTPPKHLEAMEAGQLQELANKQAEAFLGFQDSKTTALTRLSEHLTRLMDEPTRPRYIK